MASTLMMFYSVVIISFNFVNYVISYKADVKIQVLKPSGLRASILDSPEIKLFAFHAFIKEPFDENGPGEVYGSVFHSDGNSRWVFEDNDVTIKKNDVIKSYVVIQLGNELHKEILAPYKFTAISNDNTCKPSVTIVNGRSIQCRGELLFSETFDRLNTTKWLIEQKLARGQPDSPFVYYENNDDIVKVKSGKLIITPAISLYKDSDKLNLLKGCTESFELCEMTPFSFRIIPPIVSGRINSKTSFTFKYGRVKVKALVPVGDWLYPEILLEPLQQKYGPKYASGAINIAMVRGNRNLKLSYTNDTNIGNIMLVSGLHVDNNKCHDVMLNEHNGIEDWSKKYHYYEVIWEPERIIFSVDGNRYKTFTSTDFAELNSCEHLNDVIKRWHEIGEKMAPFDQEFYLTLGVGAGGITKFPDNCISDGAQKPWRNLGAKSLFDFSNSMSNWHPSWNNEAKMFIDTVEIFSV